MYVHIEIPDSVYGCVSVCICLAFGFSILPSTQIASALSV